MPPNAHDKFAALLEVGDGLLARLYHVKHRLLPSKTKLPLFNDPQCSRVVAAFARKFPDPPSDLEKVQGYEYFVSKAKGLMDELDYIYFTFVDAMDFKDIVLALLNEFTTSAYSFHIRENASIFSSYMDLIVKLVQVHVLGASIAERKQVLSLYSKCHFHNKSTEEPSYSKLASYILEYETPLKRFIVDFKGFSPKIALGLFTLKDAFAKFQNVPELRKDGLLSITLRPEQMKLPSQEPALYDALWTSRMCQWISWICLLIPEEFATKEGALYGLLKLALSTGFVLPIYRDEVFYIHQEYEALFSGYKSTNKVLNKALKKEKKLISEALASVVGGTLPTRHKDRRVYLRQELSNLFRLIEDYPGLLGPKMQIVASALFLTREEVLWYYRHRSKPFPKSNAKHPKEDEFKDERVIELIHLIHRLETLIQQHKHVVNAFYVEYLSVTDSAKLQDLIEALQKDKTLSSTVSSAFSSLIQSMTSVQLEDYMNGTQFDLQHLRRDWFRLEALLSSTSTPLPLETIPDVVARMNVIVFHSFFAESSSEFINDVASLKDLYPFKDLVVEEYLQALGSNSVQVEHIATLFHLFDQFPRIATQYYPEEVEQIGREVSEIAQQFIQSISSKVSSLVGEIAKQYIAFESQTVPNNVVFKAKEYKPDRNVPPPVEPGSESEFKNRSQLEALRLQLRTLGSLFYTLNSSFVVYHTAFSPITNLREVLANGLRDFIAKLVVLPGVVDKDFSVNIQRPSVIERQLNVYLNVLLSVEHFVNLNMPDLVREVLLGQFYNRTVLTPMGMEMDQDPTWEGDTLLKPLMQWYVELVTVKYQSGACSFAPTRLSIVNNSPGAIKFTEYASLSELRSLTRLVGPYGIKLIEIELLRYIHKHIIAIKEVLSANKAALEELLTYYYKESTIAELPRKTKDLDQFVQRSIFIGNALNFRNLLHRALRQTAKDEIPVIFEPVENLFNQYPRNTTASAEYIAFDCVAREIGIRSETTEQPLKALASTTSGTQDAALWALLPVAYAASFTTRVWGESVFRPLTENYTNNLQNLGLAILTMVSTMKAVTGVDSSEKEVAAAMMQFVEISSHVLLRFGKMSPKEVSAKFKVSSFPSLVVFIDKFLNEVSLLTRDSCENTFPYAIQRSMYRELYKPGKGQDAAEEAS